MRTIFVDNNIFVIWKKSHVNKKAVVTVWVGLLDNKFTVTRRVHHYSSYLDPVTFYFDGCGGRSQRS